MGTIIFNKLRDVTSPSRAYEVNGNSVAAGTDFYVPEYTSEFYNDLVSKNLDTSDYSIAIGDDKKLVITLSPGGRINIPSGIRVDIKDKNSCLLAANKSGVSSKKGLCKLAELIDADYHGEIHINVVNTGNVPVSIKAGDKLIQFMKLPIIYPTFVELSNEEFNNSVLETARGTGGFGSSGS